MFRHDLRHTGQSPFLGAQVAQLKWTFATGNSSSPAIGSDGTVYVGSTDGKLYAVTPAGMLKWAFATGNSIESSPAIGSDGTLYVGSDDGNLYAIGVSTSSP
jgi:outer membrane protein assembly factor BamB